MNNYFIERKVCPVCNSDKSKTLYSCIYNQNPIHDYLLDFYKSSNINWDYFKKTEYIIDECSCCNLIYQKFVPNDILLNIIYNDWLVPDNFTRYQSKKKLSNYISINYEITKILRHFNTNKLKILDYGMGWCDWLNCAKGFGCEVYGFEISEERIYHAKSNGIITLDYEEITKQQYDFINTEQVFEHILYPTKVLKHLSSSLSKDGVIKISVPADNKIKFKLTRPKWDARKYSKNSLNSIAPLEHINCFNMKSLKQMALGAGLEITKLSSKIDRSRLLNYSLKDFLFPIYWTFRGKYNRNMIFLKKI